MATVVSPTGRNYFATMYRISRSKRIGNLIANLKCRFSDRRTDSHINIFGVTTIDTLHYLDRPQSDMPYRTPPTCMRCAYHPTARIIKQQRDTIGRRKRHPGGRSVTKPSARETYSICSVSFHDKKLGGIDKTSLPCT